MAANNKRIKIKEPTSISVSEFKSWISGVEDMQGVDWFPSPEQWQKIRQKIAMLLEGEVQREQVQHTPQQNHTMQFQPVQYSSAFAPSDLQNNTVMSIPGKPAPLYAEIDLNKVPDIIAGEYKSAFQ